jgi:hypothetical protein
MCTYTSRNTNICISGLNFGNDIFLRTHYLWWSMTTKNIFTRQIDRAHFSFFPLFLWRLPHFRGFCNFLTKTVKRSECVLVPFYKPGRHLASSYYQFSKVLSVRYVISHQVHTHPLPSLLQQHSSAHTNLLLIGV